MCSKSWKCSVFSFLFTLRYMWQLAPIHLIFEPICVNLCLKDNSKSQLVPSHGQYEQWLSVHRPKFIVCTCVCACVCSGVKRLFSVRQEMGQLGWTLRAGPLSLPTINNPLYTNYISPLALHPPHTNTHSNAQNALASPQFIFYGKLTCCAIKCKVRNLKRRCLGNWKFS